MACEGVNRRDRGVCNGISSDRSQQGRLVALLVFAAVTVLALLTARQARSPRRRTRSRRRSTTAGRHLYLVPANAKGDAAVEQTGARVIARYDTFSLVSADGSANPALREAGADLRDDMRSVAVADGEVDPAAAPTLDAAGRESLSMVQFVGPVKGAWLDRIQKTGATVVTYMAQNAYLVHADADQSAAVSALAGDDAVRAVTPFTAADKTDPGVPSLRDREGHRADARRPGGRSPRVTSSPRASRSRATPRTTPP